MAKKKHHPKATQPQPVPATSPTVTSTTLVEPREELPPPPSTPARIAQPPPISTSYATNWSSGSWRGKANAVAEVARDSVSAAATSVAEKLPPATPSKTMPRQLRTPSKSTPTTQLSRDVDERSKEEKTQDVVKTREGTLVTETRPCLEIAAADGVKDNIDSAERPLPAAGWLGWWMKSHNGEEEKVDNHGVDQRENVSKTSDVPISATTAPASETGHEGTAKEQSENGNKVVKQSNQKLDSTSDLQMAQRASWFGLWTVTGQATDGSQTVNRKGSISEPEASNIASDGYSALDAQLAEPDAASTSASQREQTRNNPSWAFWSKESTKDEKKPLIEESGELAVANTSSESHPKPARMSEPEPFNSGTSTPKQQPKEGGQKSDDAVSLKTKPKASSATVADSRAGSEAVKASSASVDESGKGLDDAHVLSSAASLKRAVQKQIPQNLLLPLLRDTFPIDESPSYLQSIFRMLARTAGKTQIPKSHLAITKRPPKISKAVAIGVHGYFPAPLVQKVLGPPTGTSLKFANNAAAAISTWAATHQENHPVSVEKIALEGEGMIAVRLDTLWKLLLNFMHHLRDADLVVLSCHSQGVPVSIMLLARLISFGVLPVHCRLAVCGMAGVSLGPFADYKSRFLGTGSASELFEFSRHNSSVSEQYRSALELCLRHHVRVLYVASIDDQLVSLESALFTTISHPYIYRAVFVDGRIHAPGFITALVGLACKLRNLGISDHGLLRELSAPLAGSLYGGEGHSRIYEDAKVYDLGVEFAMETDGMIPAEDVHVKKYEVPGPNNLNPYFLPWAMRGLLGEERVRRDMSVDVEELIKLFEDWKPQTKQLKDVKLRLEALRSKL